MEGGSGSGSFFRLLPFEVLEIVSGYGVSGTLRAACRGGSPLAGVVHCSDGCPAWTGAKDFCEGLCFRCPEALPGTSPCPVREGFVRVSEPMTALAGLFGRSRSRSQPLLSLVTRLVKRSHFGSRGSVQLLSLYPQKSFAARLCDAVEREEDERDDEAILLCWCAWMMLHSFRLDCKSASLLRREAASLEASRSLSLAVRAVLVWPRGLEALPDWLRGDPSVVVAAVRRRGASLEHASDALKDDLDVVLAAVEQDGYSLKFASERLRGDAYVRRAAVLQNGCLLAGASPELCGDRALILGVVEKQGFLLLYASEALRDDREVAEAAVESWPEAIRYVGRSVLEASALASRRDSKTSSAVSRAPSIHP